MADDKVLVALDGSKYAEHALDYYLQNLHQESNEVILLYCPELTNLSTKGPAPTYDKMQKKIQEEEKNIEQLKAKYEAKAKANNLKYEFKVVHTGKPGEAIVMVAGEQLVSYVVTGTRGLGSIRRTVLGSVSDYVVHHAHCPVVVCRH